MSRLADSRYDFIVVGGGAMGSAAAWQLARRGRSVLLLERFQAGHAYGASHGGVRIFRYGYSDPTYVRMVQAALPLWRELEAEAGEPLLELTGAVDHGPVGEIEELAAAYRECGVLHESLTPGAATERWPGLRFDAAVLAQPNAGRTRADATVAALHRAAAAAGAEIRCETQVITIEATPTGVAIRTEDAELGAAVAVVAVGAWAQPLLTPLGIPLPPLRSPRSRCSTSRRSRAGREATRGPRSCTAGQGSGTDWRHPARASSWVNIMRAGPVIRSPGTAASPLTLRRGNGRADMRRRGYPASRPSR